MLRLLFIIGLLLFLFSPIYSDSSTLTDTTNQLPQVGGDLGGFLSNIDGEIAVFILALFIIIPLIGVALAFIHLFILKPFIESVKKRNS